MVEKKYIANELVCFAKYVAGKSRCGRYLMIGYYNKDKSKFKHISSGNVYDVKGARIELSRPGFPGSEEIQPKGEYKTPVIEDMGQAFVQVEPEVNGVSSQYKSRYMTFSKPCIFSKLYPEAFREYNGRVGFKNLYDFIEKQQCSEPLTISGIELFQAEREANMYSACWLYNADEREDSSFEPLSQERRVSPTEAERDF